MPLSKTDLPVLPFRHRSALSSDSILDFCESAARVLPGQWDIRSREPDQSFVQRSAPVAFNDLGMVALTSSSIEVQRSEVPLPMLMVGFAGRVDYRVAGQTLTQQHGAYAVFLSGKAHEALSHPGYGSVQIAFNPEALNRTLDAMLGQARGISVSLALSQDRQIPLVYRGFSIHKHLRHCFDLIHHLDGQPELCSALGIDDMLYRVFVLMLCPELLTTLGFAAAQPDDHPALDRLCEYIDAHLDERITLTDMERLSGLSHRGLQYAFNRRFHCAPMVWVRQRRLQRAREMLLREPGPIHVTRVALMCGFNNLGNFARSYAERFGEKPNETLARYQFGDV